MIDLDELERLRGNCAPGTWHSDNGYRVKTDPLSKADMGYGKFVDESDEEYNEKRELCLFETKYGEGLGGESDYIAALHNALPDLIAELRAYRLLRDELEARERLPRWEAALDGGGSVDDDYYIALSHVVAKMDSILTSGMIVPK